MSRQVIILELMIDHDIEIFNHLKLLHTVVLWTATDYREMDFAKQ